jgi:hypothetical protein
MGRGTEAPVSDGSILVVRHGPDRGRMPGYLDPSFEALARSDPSLYRRFRLHRTGEKAPELGDARALVLLLGDPLRELYPACYAEAAELAAQARRRGIRVVNDPDALSNSIKSVQARIWTESGIPTPVQRRFTDPDELDTILRTIEFPLLVRADELHAQERMYLCREPADVRRIPRAELPMPGAVAPFVDVREEYRASGATGPYADFFHKKRVYVFGDVVQPNHVYFSEQPIVSKRTSTLLAYKKLRHRGPAAHYRAHRLYQASIDADLDYAEHGDAHGSLMHRATHVLDLDFVAIDYVVRPDGSPLLWEANPHFSLPAWYLNLLPLKRRLRRRYRVFHEAMGKFFRSLLA